MHLPSGSNANCWHSWECAQRQHVWLNKETLMLFRPAITARSSFSIACNSLLNLFSTISHIIECDSPRQPNGRLCLFSRKWGPAKCLAADSLFKDGHSAEHPLGGVETLTYRAFIVQKHICADERSPDNRSDCTICACIEWSGPVLWHHNKRTTHAREIL